MASRGNTVIDMLERDWATTGRQPACLPGFATMNDVVGHVQRRTIGPDAADRVLLLLLTRATAGEELAARTVLQALLPACKAMVGRHRFVGDADELSAAVVAAMYERIRTYPVARRPGKVAANIALDVRQRVFARHRRELDTTPYDDLDPGVSWDGPTAHAADELIELLDWAVATGHLDRDAAALIGRTRIGDVAVDELCIDTGDKAQSVRRRRQRAEACLRSAVLASEAA
jgi:DNA-directed RNA polymerase specialized sigma24 family protein